VWCGGKLGLDTTRIPKAKEFDQHAGTTQQYLGFLAAATSVVSQEIEAAGGREEMATDVAVKERPILFSGAMVRAILEGRKTQTRRVMKPQPDHLQIYGFKGKRLYDGEHRLWCWNGEMEDLPQDLAQFSPYGVPGDRLWVRETWQRPFTEMRPSSTGGEAGYIYLADGPDFLSMASRVHNWSRTEGQWKPSIHMPRRASRLTLEVTRVRVERLCDISGMDAVAEGYAAGGNSSDGESRAREAFLNGDWARSKREANPWVWAIEFKTVPPAATEGQ
jgi:hypothetical protein